MKFLSRIEIAVFLFWTAIFAGWLIRLFPLRLEWGGFQWIGSGGALIGAGALLLLFVLGKFAVAIRKQNHRRKIDTAREFCRGRTGDAFDSFGERLRRIAGTEKVLLIMPWEEDLDHDPEYQVLRSFLNRNRVTEKCFAARNGSILYGKQREKINRAIRGCRSCRTILFFRAFTPDNLQRQLEALFIFTDPPEHSPELVLFLRQTVCSGAAEVDDSSVPAEYLEQITAAGRVAEITILAEHVVLQGREAVTVAARAFHFPRNREGGATISPLPEKTEHVTLKELFAENVRYVRIAGFAVPALAILPGVQHGIEPYFCSGEDRAVFIFQLIVLFLPLLTAGGVCAVALGIALQQNRWIAVMREERQRRNVSAWEELLLCLPGIRYWFLGRALVGELPRSSRWLLWGMIAGAALYWITGLVIGPLSPVPPVALAVSAGCWLGVARCIAGVPLQNRERLGWLGLLIAFLLVTLPGYLLYYQTQHEIRKETRLLQNIGVPVNRGELKQFLNRGGAPNAEFGALVNRCRNFPPSMSTMEYFASPESGRRKLKACLAGEEYRADFLPLESLIGSGGRLKYPRSLPDGLLIDPGFLSESYLIAAARCYSLRIVAALEEQDGEEAMRLYRVMTRFLDLIPESDFLLEALAVQAIENIHCDTIGALLGSGLLSDAQLREVAESNRGRIDHLRVSFQGGRRGTAYLSLELLPALAVPYPDVLLVLRLNVLNYVGPEIRDGTLEFLFRGNTTLIPTFPCLWTETVRQQDRLLAMRHLRIVTEYLDHSERWSPGADEALKREVANAKWYQEPFVGRNPFFGRDQLLRAETCCRMAELALQIETFRREKGRLPETLAELCIPLPVDALSGEAIRFTRAARIFRYENERVVPVDFPGWQLSAPGGNYRMPPKFRQEWRRDTFTVITEWPVPAPPEPPEK